MSTDYTDGNIISDSFKTSIDGNIYVANNFNLTAPTVESTRQGVQGDTEAWKGVIDNGQITGTGELQINATAQLKDLRLTPFAVPADANLFGETIYCIVTSITSNTVIGQSRTISVNVRKLINDPSPLPTLPTDPEE